MTAPKINYRPERDALWLRNIYVRVFGYQPDPDNRTHYLDDGRSCVVLPQMFTEDPNGTMHLLQRMVTVGYDTCFIDGADGRWAVTFYSGDEQFEGPECDTFPRAVFEAVCVAIDDDTEPSAAQLERLNNPDSGPSSTGPGFAGGRPMSEHDRRL